MSVSEVVTAEVGYPQGGLGPRKVRRLAATVRSQLHHRVLTRRQPYATAAPPRRR